MRYWVNHIHPLTYVQLILSSPYSLSRTLGKPHTPSRLSPLILTGRKRHLTSITYLIPNFTLPLLWDTR